MCMLRVSGFSKIWKTFFIKSIQEDTTVTGNYMNPMETKTVETTTKLMIHFPWFRISNPINWNFIQYWILSMQISPSTWEPRTEIILMIGILPTTANMQNILITNTTTHHTGVGRLGEVMMGEEATPNGTNADKKNMKDDIRIMTKPAHNHLRNESVLSLSLSRTSCLILHPPTIPLDNGMATRLQSIIPWYRSW